MIQNQRQIIQMKPTANLIDGRIVINEFDTENREMGTFVVIDAPWTSGCDDLVNAMNEFIDFAKNQKTLYPDRQERYNVYQEKRLELWMLAAKVEDELNAAIGVR